MIEISPKNSPRPSRARSVPSTTTAASPSRMTYTPEPVRPWRRTFSPSANMTSSKMWTMLSRRGSGRSANSANDAIVSTNSSRVAISAWCQMRVAHVSPARLTRSEAQRSIRDDAPSTQEDRMTLTIDRKAELLSAAHLFEGVDAEGMDRIAAVAVQVEFPANHVVARQGEIGTGFFVV